MLIFLYHETRSLTGKQLIVDIFLTGSGTLYPLGEQHTCNASTFAVATTVVVQAEESTEIVLSNVATLAEGIVHS